MMEATAWIALVALGFTGTQAWIAHRKLRFDLFTKRYEAWESINDLINAKIDKLPSCDHTVIKKLGLTADHIYDNEQAETLRQIFRLQRQIQFMFPPEVSESIDKVLQAITLRDAAKMQLVEFQNDGHDETSEKILRAKELLISKNKLIEHDQFILASCVHRHIHLYSWIDTTGSALRESYQMWRDERAKRR